jgi:hypothetical protein
MKLNEIGYGGRVFRISHPAGRDIEMEFHTPSPYRLIQGGR